MQDHPLGKIIRELNLKLKEAEALAEGHLPLFSILSTPKALLNKLINNQLKNIYVNFDKELTLLEKSQPSDTAKFVAALEELNNATLHLTRLIEIRLIDIDANLVDPIDTKDNYKKFGNTLISRCKLCIESLNGRVPEPEISADANVPEPEVSTMSKSA